jgi:hypothetical protein
MEADGQKIMITIIKLLVVFAALIRWAIRHHCARLLARKMCASPLCQYHRALMLKLYGTDTKGHHTYFLPANGRNYAFPSW